MRTETSQDTKQLRLSLPIILVGVVISACSNVDTVLLTSETFPPKSSVHDIEVLEQEPTRPHINIAELSIASRWLSVEQMRQKILEKAATLGADAVVFAKLDLPSLTPRAGGAGTDKPSPGSKPAGDGKLGPVSASPSGYTQIGIDEVKIILVRGGGGHGHGGGMRGGSRGRSAPFAARPWARYYAPYYGPSYWGYGPYGPGSWGYAPYWRGYDPYWGSYPYGGGYPFYQGGWDPGFDFMTTVISGMAIRYTRPNEP